MAFSIDSQSLLSVGASMYCCKAGHVLAGQLKGIAPHIRDVSSITQGPQVPHCCSLLSTRNTFFSKFSSYQEVIYLYKVIYTLWQASERPIMITSSDKFDSTSDRLLSFSVIIGVTDISCCIKWYYLLSPCFLFVVNTCLSTQHKSLQNIWPPKIWGNLSHSCPQPWHGEYHPHRTWKNKKDSSEHPTPPIVQNRFWKGTYSIVAAMP